MRNLAEKENNEKSMVSIRHLYKSYGNGISTTRALYNINLEVERGEILAIVGESGSGKTTLLNLIGGLDVCEEGEIYLDGELLDLGNDKAMAECRRESIGYVFEKIQLIPGLNVLENILLPVRLRGGAIEKKQLTTFLKRLEVFQMRREPLRRLSAEERQKVAVARALVNIPKLVLADEPTGNLNSRSGDYVLDLLIQYCRDYGQTLILATHNRAYARLADRCVEIKDGRISAPAS